MWQIAEKIIKYQW